MVANTKINLCIAFIVALIILTSIAGPVIGIKSLERKQCTIISHKYDNCYQTQQIDNDDYSYQAEKYFDINIENDDAIGIVTCKVPDCENIICENNFVINGTYYCHKFENTVYVISKFNSISTKILPYILLIFLILFSSAVVFVGVFELLNYYTANKTHTTNTTNTANTANITNENNYIDKNNINKITKENMKTQINNNEELTDTVIDLSHGVKHMTVSTRSSSIKLSDLSPNTSSISDSSSDDTQNVDLD